MKKLEIRILRNEQDYYSALGEAERLVALDPDPATKNAENLELLTLLIEDYEKRVFPMDTPDPIEAIEFRMEEQNLRQKDLVSLIGSRSRVSEVLARKRALTIPMIRALSDGLGIPLDILVSKSGKASRKPENNFKTEETVSPDWKKFPYGEMKKRGWFESCVDLSKATIEESVQAFLSQLSADTAVMFRRRFLGKEVDDKVHYSVLAWTIRVLIKAKDESRKLETKFSPSIFNTERLRDLAQLSWFPDGPKQAISFLEKCGVIVVIEPRLPNALIDGAAMRLEDGTPVIGLTLRYDRIDYFWFTLLHEVIHVWKHINSRNEVFIDRLENLRDAEEQNEKQANRLARDALVPRAIWKRSSAFSFPSKENIQQLADELHIHPAIIAGRLQYETGRFSSFRELLGQGEVRKLFPNLVF